MTEVYVLQLIISNDIRETLVYDNIHDAVLVSIYIVTTHNIVERKKKVQHFEREFALGRVNKSNMNDFGIAKKNTWFWTSGCIYTEISVGIFNKKIDNANL